MLVRQRIKIILTVFVILTSNILYAEEERGIRSVIIKDTTGQEVGLYNESHALVIGVSDYNNGWPTLPGVRNDVDAVSESLRDNGFQVETVMDPDRRELDEAFTAFIGRNGRKKENRLLFYFAGHGYTIQPKWGGESMGYIVPKDAPNPNTSEAQFKDIALPMQRIEEYALGIDSKHALFLFDSCFSGTLFAITRAAPEDISYKTVKPVRQFITAGSADEEVPDASIFRRQFVAALRGEGDVNQDGFLTGTELGEFLQSKVINYSRGAQHPQYGKIRNPHLDKGDFVFQMPQLLYAPVSVAGPSESRFTLDDLYEQVVKEETLEHAWNEKLAELKAAFNEVKFLEKRDISVQHKIEAWKRFQHAFSDDNPYSREDDLFRNEAKERLRYWNRQTRDAKPDHQPRPVVPDLPGWVLMPPEGGISSVGYAEVGAAGMSVARMEAIAYARDEIARTMNVKVKNMIKNFTETTGVGDDQTVDKVFTGVSKQVAKVDLTGSSVKNVYYDQVNREIYVLVALKPHVVSAVCQTMKKAVIDSYKNDQRSWQKFQAKKAYEELDKEIEKEFGPF